MIPSDLEQIDFFTEPFLNFGKLNEPVNICDIDIDQELERILFDDNFDHFERLETFEHPEPVPGPIADPTDQPTNQTDDPFTINLNILGVDLNFGNQQNDNNVFDCNTDKSTFDQTFLREIDQLLNGFVGGAGDLNGSGSDGSETCDVTFDTFEHLKKYERRRYLLHDNARVVSAPKQRTHTSPPKPRAAKPSDTVKQQFQCPYATCAKIYSKAPHLKSHLRRHSGERPFACTWPTCAWRFSRSDELARHRRMHSGVKPYKCDMCDKSFARSDHLAKHHKVHVRRMAMRMDLKKNQKR